MGRLRPWTGIHTLAAVAAGLILAVTLADALLAAPMRRWAERTMNAKLVGYTVRIGRVRPHLWRLAFELNDLALRQTSHPEPPVADIGALEFSLLGWELLHLKLAGNLTIRHPALHLNLPQIQAEARGQGRFQDRGWQPAVEALFPFRLNRVAVRDASLVYLAEGTAGKPLRFTGVDLVAQNIRNIRAARGTYPSPLTLEGRLFDTGTVRFDGAADFLREPRAAAMGTFTVERVPLDRLDPLTHDYQVKTAGGLLSATGMVESTPELQRAHLAELRFDGLRVDYRTSAATHAQELAHARMAVDAARQVRNQRRLDLRVDRLLVTDGEFGFENQSANPPYRLFVAKAQFELRHLGNRSAQGRASFEAKGVFMGSGATVAHGGFLPADRPDFDLHLRMEGASLPDLNRFLRANAGMDVARGRLSVFSELTVKDGRVEGYLKPLVQDLQVYDPAKDRDKPLGKRVEAHLLQFLAGILKNRDTGKVATVARISGPTGQPGVSEWEAIRKLLRNGFIQAIRPGFLGGEAKDGKSGDGGKGSAQ
jgi:hypothetical protein